MKFLQTLGECFRSFLPSKKLLPSDPLARYIFSKRHFNREKGVVLTAAFMPPPPPNKPETSVFQIRGLSERKIWNIGRKVGRVRSGGLKARGDILIEVVSQAGLSVYPDRWPRRHANIIGWPKHEKKSEQMVIAAKLALAAKLKLPS
jgi:hypothetical protein